MSNEVMRLSYESNFGRYDIRSGYFNNILHFSLKDIFVALNKENREMGEENPAKYMPTLIKSQLEDLDDDEYFLTPDFELKGINEVFVTQPGLNRVMGSNKSRAGRKFQRWLYHDVVPSLTKHGVYPPPITAQGSALSQMAEILAQNSRALADAIVSQDRLEKEMDVVKGEVSDVSVRLNKLEEGTSSEFVSTVSEWFDKKGFFIAKEKELTMVAWCENLSLSEGARIIKNPSEDRLKEKFHDSIIAKVKRLIDDSEG